MIIPILVIIMSVTLGSIYYQGIVLIDKGKMNVGNIVQIFQISIHIITAFFAIAILCILIKSIIDAVKNIKKILNYKTDNTNGSIKIANIKNLKIEFKNVSVIDNNIKILNDINFFWANNNWKQ